MVLAFAVIFSSGFQLFAATKGDTSIGLYGSFAGDATGSVGGLGITAKFGHIPIGIKYNFSNPAAIGASVDYHIVDDEKLIDALRFYLGLGAFLGIHFSSSNPIDLGARIPIGLQFYPIKQLEVYLGAIPTLRFLPSLSLGLGGELGVRIHF